MNSLEELKAFNKLLIAHGETISSGYSRRCSLCGKDTSGMSYSDFRVHRRTHLEEFRHFLAFL